MRAVPSWSRAALRHRVLPDLPHRLRDPHRDAELLGLTDGERDVFGRDRHACAEVERRGRIERANLFRVALLLASPALMISSIVSGSRPAFTPRMNASHDAAIPVAESRLLRSLSVCAFPVSSPR